MALLPNCPSSERRFGTPGQLTTWKIRAAGTSATGEIAIHRGRYVPFHLNSLRPHPCGFHCPFKGSLVGQPKQIGGVEGDIP